MRISTFMHTRNSWGGHLTITLVGEFLEMGSQDFGGAIKELDIHIYFRNSKVTAGVNEQYGRFLEELPSAKFLRKKNRFELNYVTAAGDATILSGNDHPKFSPFTASVREVVAMLPAIKAKLKRADDFDYPAFMSFIEGRMEKLPRTEAEFARLRQDIQDEQKRKFDALDEWKKLRVDWSDYHPEARRILDAPFFWDCTNDFSPNGNDTGADVLAFYQEWRKRNKKRDGMDFLAKLMKEWDVKMPPPKDDEFSRKTYREAIIGLAFSEMKVDGICQPHIVRLALDAITEMGRHTKEFCQDGNLFGERINSLQAMEKKLQEVMPCHVSPASPDPNQ